MRRALEVAGLLVVLVLVPALAFGEGDAKRGNDLFHKNCSSCHGNAGKGDGPAAIALNPKPRDLSDKSYMSERNDQYLSDLVKKGGTALGKSPLMPAMGAVLNDGEVADVIAYIRTLAK